MFTNINIHSGVNPLSFIAKEHSLIHVYKDGMEYSYSIKENACLDILYHELIRSAIPITMDDFIRMHKKDIVWIIYAPSEISFIEVYSVAVKLRLNMETVKIIANIVIAALGLDHLWPNETVHCISYKDDYVAFESGILLEILQTETCKNKLEQEYWKCHLKLTREEYMNAYFKGVITNSLMIEDKIKNLVLLDTIKTDINISIEIGGSVRNFTCVLDANTTMPAKKDFEFYLDKGDMFAYIDNVKLKFPIHKLFGCIPDKIRILVDITPNSIITFILINISTKMEFHYTLYELICENCFQDNRTTISLSPKEQEYVDTVKECMEENNEISFMERRLLEKLRIRLNVSEERAKELEESLLSLMIKLTAEEKEYQDEYKACLEEDGEITSKERRLLDKLRLSLGISEERAKEIENTNL